MFPMRSIASALVFFDQARSTAEANYKKNPLDAENLTRWGGALLELAQFQSGSDSNKYLQDAVGKLEEALEIEPRRADTLWCLGNAHTSYAFLSTNQEAAGAHFTKATQCFEQAVEEAPGNHLYRKSLDISHKSPELHMEIQRQMTSQPAAAKRSSSTKVKVSKKKINTNLKYDILGWMILAVGVVAWVGMAKSHVPSPPPR